MDFALDTDDSTVILLLSAPPEENYGTQSDFKGVSESKRLRRSLRIRAKYDSGNAEELVSDMAFAEEDDERGRLPFGRGGSSTPYGGKHRGGIDDTSRTSTPYPATQFIIHAPNSQFRTVSPSREPLLLQQQFPYQSLVQTRPDVGIGPHSPARNI